MITHILDKSLSANIKSFNEKIAQLDPTQRHKITIKDFTETRSELQNRCSHGWYNELHSNLGEETALGYKCFCKLNFGVGILRAEDDEFREMYDKAIKGLSYEKKLLIMQYLPVTSIMSTKQLSQYLELIKSHFYTYHGYDLRFPQDY